MWAVTGRALSLRSLWLHPFGSRPFWLCALSLGAAACNPTEPPFHNAYWDNYKDGLYVDAANGEPLFSSRDKYDSGTGWPSFTQPIEPERVVTSSDWSFGALRTEVRASGSDAHLGHVFGDGPPPTGLRYCINSFALRFIPVGELDGHGYREYRALFAPPPAQASAGVINVMLSDDGLGDSGVGSGLVGASVGGNVGDSAGNNVVDNAGDGVPSLSASAEQR